MKGKTDVAGGGKNRRQEIDIYWNFIGLVKPEATDDETAK